MIRIEVAKGRNHLTILKEEFGVCISPFVRYPF